MGDECSKTIEIINHEKLFLVVTKKVLLNQSRSDLLMPLTSGRSLNLSRSFYIIQCIPCNSKASTFPGSLSASSYGMLQLIQQHSCFSCESQTQFVLSLSIDISPSPHLIILSFELSVVSSDPNLQYHYFCKFTIFIFYSIIENFTLISGVHNT